MKKANIIGLCIVFMATTAGYAQQSANASGGDASGSGGTVAYSIGQVIYTSVSGATGTSNQGVQQPFEFFVTGIDDFPGIQLEMTAYPNPTRSSLNLRIESEYQPGMSYQLYNAAGQLITGARIENVITEIPMQGLAAGNYKLRIFNAESTLKTFSIIKTN
jgi:hypothetical protein